LSFFSCSANLPKPILLDDIAMIFSWLCVQS
jgi:hypothetical protein